MINSSGSAEDITYLYNRQVYQIFVMSSFLEDGKD